MQIPLFASLPRDEIQNLAGILGYSELAPGATLLLEGERGDCFFIILSGQIEIIKALGTEDERLLNVRTQGDFLGEMSMFDRDGLHTASARTRTPVTLLRMTHANLEKVLHRQPDLAYRIMRELSLRLRDADNATILDLKEKNRQLAEAYRKLQAAQAQIIEKEKLEKELQVARKIQESMLPTSLPRLPGFDFGARMSPARAVGGDFFDFIPFKQGGIGVVIGDVSDKGVPAALFMALVRSLLRAEASRARQPSQVLKRINHTLLEMNAASMFITVLYGVLDPGQRLFQYARAGHELPLLIDQNGEVSEPVLGQGQLLGLFSAPSLDIGSLLLPPGSTLLMYTDGALDLKSPQGDFFGHQRLNAVVRANPNIPAQALCDQVLNALLAYQGDSPQADDVTLVAIHSQLNSSDQG